MDNSTEMNLVPRVSMLGLNSKVVRTYSLGVKFKGTRMERREQEKEANQRVKGLQVRQEDMIFDRNTIRTSLNIARQLPKQDSKFAPAIIQETTKNYANIGNSAYYMLHVAAKGTVDREKKVSDLFDIIDKWKMQAIEWIVFGRSPRVETALQYKWKVKRIYAINFLYSTRRQIDKLTPSHLKFNNLLPFLSEDDLQIAIEQFYNQKDREMSLSTLLPKQKSFLSNLELLSNNKDIIAPLLQTWLYSSQKSRWRSLKILSIEIAKILDQENRVLFSALRSIIVSALFSEIGKTALKIIKNSDPENCVSPPFKRKKKGRMPIILLMKKDYVVIRPGNAQKMTELALKDGSFDLGFPLKGFPRIEGSLIFPKKVYEYIKNGAKIKVLQIKHGLAPSYKLRVSVILEGSFKMFLSTKLTKELCKRVKTKPTEVLGLDLNRLSDYMLVFSNNIPLPKQLKFLIKRYHDLNSRLIPQMSNSLKVKGRERDPHKFLKTKGELNRLYNKKKKILSEIKHYVPYFVAAVLIKSKSSFLCIEDLNFNPQRKKKSLAKAFYSMPDEIDIFEKAVLIASKISGKKIKLIKINPRGTSSFHYRCKGRLSREQYYYDNALCAKCGNMIDAHKNAAQNIREKGEKLLQSTNYPSSHARVTV